MPWITIGHGYYRAAALKSRLRKSLAPFFADNEPSGRQAQAIKTNAFEISPARLPRLILRLRLNPGADAVAHPWCGNDSKTKHRACC